MGAELGANRPERRPDAPNPAPPRPYDRSCSPIPPESDLSVYFLGRSLPSLLAFGGRPRGRRLASRPKSIAAWRLQGSLPNGVPRSTLRRSRSRSEADNGALT